ncbi:MAG: hypothetical protein J5I99_05840, partial [Verrucomicrobia bacterium]|nr:hypothetical protein [Verrucomicrobiota bacterium]
MSAERYSRYLKEAWFLLDAAAVALSLTGTVVLAEKVEAILSALAIKPTPEECEALFQGCSGISALRAEPISNLSEPQTRKGETREQTHQERL